MEQKEYLDSKNISYRESNGELILTCVFCNKPKHLYLNPEKGVFHCKRCGESGGMKKFKEQLGDGSAATRIIPITKPTASPPVKPKPQPLDPTLIEQYHQALPAPIRQYLNDRGIPDEIINERQLGWAKLYDQWWITIPVKNRQGEYTLLKLRRDPNDTSNPDKMKVYPFGATHEIFGWDLLTNNQEMVVIGEGEFDSLVLCAQGIPAVTSTGGSGTFKDEWLEPFKNIKQVYICYDADESGRQGAQRVINKLMGLNGPEVFRIDLPDMGEGRKDVTDYFVHSNGTLDNFMMLAKEVIPFEGARIKPVEKVEHPLSFTEWRQTIATNFPHFLFPAEVGLAVVAQILIKDVSNPFALVFVDVPSAGKTITINFFAGIEGITYSTDKFTPSAFVSNAVNVKRSQLRKIDLLPRIRHKMFLIRDLAPIFGQRDDDLLESLGILTRVLDGEGLQTDTGIHGQREYVGDYLFMMLAGSTPIHPRVWKLMGNLGSRLFFLNIDSPDKSDQDLINQLTSTSYKIKELKCREATKNFLLTLWQKHPKGVGWDKNQDDPALLVIIVRCARLLARLRGTINVWDEKSDGAKRHNYTTPVIEKPDRINQLFYNLCRGHALVQGRTQLIKEDLRTVVELATDSAPIIRSKLFHALINHGGTMGTEEVEKALNCSKPTALKEMKALTILGICSIEGESDGDAGHPETTITLKEDFHWFLDEECYALRHPTPPAITLSDSAYQSSPKANLTA